MGAPLAIKVYFAARFHEIFTLLMLSFVNMGQTLCVKIKGANPFVRKTRTPPPFHISQNAESQSFLKVRILVNFAGDSPPEYEMVVGYKSKAELALSMSRLQPS
jgi:hypothetical protein